ncbi:MAG: sulfurtransferase TusA family protein, partial [Aestuariivirgaceae bacterium]
MLVHVAAAPDGSLGHPQWCIAPRAYGTTLAQPQLPWWCCDDKIALLEYTMAGRDTSRLDKFAEQIDVRGMLCPLPVLKAQKRLKTMENGELLKVLATDPAAVIDFPHFCNEVGHELVSSDQSDGV